MAFKPICLALVLGCGISLPAASHDISNFNSYVEGALKVYAQFKEPSKQESEQFYGFLKSKWKSEVCSKNCDLVGRNAGVEYANRMRIQLDNEVQ
ncbi:rI-like antiholin [Klebsiella phage Metamorpho]|nr:rI-like antiholin [Klebsiella phage Metamorpho]